ncbi:MAG: TilS substrate-binding domain-containing protein, partial [Chloroflexota bacterium]|nr:TilS substrate-binding domain-containing protein [Chloroflexota bacterium]
VLAAEPAALRRRAIRRWLRARTGLLGPTADRTDAVLGLIDAGEGGRSIEVGEGWVVGVRRGVLRVARMQTDAGGLGSGAIDVATAPTRGEERS